MCFGSFVGLMDDAVRCKKTKDYRQGSKGHCHWRKVLGRLIIGSKDNVGRSMMLLKR